MRAILVLATALASPCGAQTLFNNAVKGGLTGEGFRTGPRPGGGDYSEVQFGNASTGVSFRRTAYWLADDFEVVGARWRVRSVTVWGYQDGLHFPSIDQGFVEIRKGSHVGPTVGAGTWASSEMTDIYRILNARPDDNRQCQKVTFNIDAWLGPGKHWVVFAALGVVNVNGPWSPMLTKIGELTVPGANAKGRVSGQTIYWVDIVDPGQWPWTPQDLPFWIDGEKLPITAQPGERVDPPMVVPDPVAPLMRAVAR